VVATIVEEEALWVESVFIKRLERGQTMERPLKTQEGVVGHPAILSTSYEGDDSIRVEVIRGSSDGGPAAQPRIKISRPIDSTTGGLVRGMLSLQAEGAPIKIIKIAVFLPR
jgi:hypothetical protein